MANILGNIEAERYSSCLTLDRHKLLVFHLPKTLGDLVQIFSKSQMIFSLYLNRADNDFGLRNTGLSSNISFQLRRFELQLNISYPHSDNLLAGYLNVLISKRWAYGAVDILCGQREVCALLSIVGR